MVKFEMDYADAAVLEFALDEFIKKHRQRITRLQTIQDKNNAEKQLIKVYENRVRNARKVFTKVSLIVGGYEND
jgi:low affinity Fe/Cu permease